MWRPKSHWVGNRCDGQSGIHWGDRMLRGTSDLLLMSDVGHVVAMGMFHSCSCWTEGESKALRVVERGVGSHWRLMG
jgi:hypothetical protein